jgi:predicted small secreted protein
MERSCAGNHFPAPKDINHRSFLMAKTVTVIAALFATMVSLSSCGNTIRGLGQDTANTVDATQSAGKRVGNAAEN